MSIWDWETAEKIQQKLEKVLILSNIYWNFEKKIEKHSEKKCGNFENFWENF